MGSLNRYFGNKMLWRFPKIFKVLGTVRLSEGEFVVRNNDYFDDFLDFISKKLKPVFEDDNFLFDEKITKELRSLFLSLSAVSQFVSDNVKKSAEVNQESQKVAESLKKLFNIISVEAKDKLDFQSLNLDLFKGDDVEEILVKLNHNGGLFKFLYFLSKQDKNWFQKNKMELKDFFFGKFSFLNYFEQLKKFLRKGEIKKLFEEKDYESVLFIFSLRRVEVFEKMRLSKTFLNYFKQSEISDEVISRIYSNLDSSKHFVPQIMGLKQNDEVKFFLLLKFVKNEEGNSGFYFKKHFFEAQEEGLEKMTELKKMKFKEKHIIELLDIALIDDFKSLIIIKEGHVRTKTVEILYDLEFDWNNNKLLFKLKQIVQKKYETSDHQEIQYLALRILLKQKLNQKMKDEIFDMVFKRKFYFYISDVVQFEFREKFKNWIISENKLIEILNEISKITNNLYLRELFIIVLVNEKKSENFLIKVIKLLENYEYKLFFECLNFKHEDKGKTIPVDEIVDYKNNREEDRERIWDSLTKIFILNKNLSLKKTKILLLLLNGKNFEENSDKILNDLLNIKEYKNNKQEFFRLLMNLSPEIRKLFLLNYSTKIKDESFKNSCKFYFCRKEIEEELFLKLILSIDLNENEINEILKKLISEVGDLNKTISIISKYVKKDLLGKILIIKIISDLKNNSITINLQNIVNKDNLEIIKANMTEELAEKVVYEFFSQTKISNDILKNSIKNYHFRFIFDFERDLKTIMRITSKYKEKEKYNKILIEVIISKPNIFKHLVTKDNFKKLEELFKKDEIKEAFKQEDYDEIMFIFNIMRIEILERKGISEDFSKTFEEDKKIKEEMTSRILRGMIKHKDGKTLDLSSKLLHYLPKNIEYLKYLKEIEILKLGGNRLDSLPDSLTELKNLKKLYLGVNSFSSFPKTITQLQNLEVLDLENNKLSFLPEDIEKLQKLQTLKLRNNNFSYLPKNIIKLVNLKKIFFDRFIFLPLELYKNLIKNKSSLNGFVLFKNVEEHKLLDLVKSLFSGEKIEIKSTEKIFLLSSESISDTCFDLEIGYNDFINNFNGVFVKFKGQIIGGIKSMGSKTYISFKTIIDKKTNNVVQIPGMVYYPSSELLTKTKEVKKSGDIIFHLNKKDAGGMLSMPHLRTFNDFEYFLNNEKRIIKKIYEEQKKINDKKNN